MRFRIISFFAILLILASCSTPKNITYFQDAETGQKISVSDPIEIKIRPKDKISILVTTQDLRLTNLFNLPIISQQVGQEISSNYARGLSGYTVNSEGYIDFPVIGKIEVAGLTREAVAEKIREELLARDLVKDPVVTVEFMNLAVSVMGEVNRPGRFSIDKDNLTIIEALSMAGDLSIFGERENVLVIRNVDGVQKAYRVDLTNANDLYASPVFYLQQNDMVYVTPNEYKARQSTVNGNNVRSTSFWISLASLLTSVAVLVFK